MRTECSFRYVDLSVPPSWENMNRMYLFWTPAVYRISHVLTGADQHSKHHQDRRRVLSKNANSEKSNHSADIKKELANTIEPLPKSDPPVHWPCKMANQKTQKSFWNAFCFWFLRPDIPNRVDWMKLWHLDNSCSSRNFGRLVIVWFFSFFLNNEKIYTTYLTCSVDQTCRHRVAAWCPWCLWGHEWSCPLWTTWATLRTWASCFSVSRGTHAKEPIAHRLVPWKCVAVESWSFTCSSLTIPWLWLLKKPLNSFQL